MIMMSHESKILLRQRDSSYPNFQQVSPQAERLKKAFMSAAEIAQYCANHASSIDQIGRASCRERVLNLV